MGKQIKVINNMKFLGDIITIGNKVDSSRFVLVMISLVGSVLFLVLSFVIVYNYIHNDGYKSILTTISNIILFLCLLFVMIRTTKVVDSFIELKDKNKIKNN